MSTAISVDRAAKGMVKRQAERMRHSEGEAIVRIAQKLRLSPNTFGNVVRKRVKKISADIRDKIVAACIADLSRKITRLEHERQMLIQMGSSPRSDDMDCVESALDTARAAILRMKGGK